MDERMVTETIAGLFAFCTNDKEVHELSDMLNDVVMQESENRLYDLKQFYEKGV